MLTETHESGDLESPKGSLSCLSAGRSFSPGSYQAVKTHRSHLCLFSEAGGKSPAIPCFCWSSYREAAITNSIESDSASSEERYGIVMGYWRGDFDGKDLYSVFLHSIFFSNMISFTPGQRSWSNLSMY